MHGYTFWTEGVRQNRSEVIVPIAKAVTKHSAQLATGSTFAKKKAAERASATLPTVPSPRANAEAMEADPESGRHPAPL